MLKRICTGALLACLMGVIPLTSDVSNAQSTTTFRVLSGPRQLASPYDTTLPSLMHRFANVPDFIRSTVAATRRYYAVSGHIDQAGNWAYPFNVAMTGPVYSEELGIDLRAHMILVGVGAMSPAVVSQLRGHTGPVSTMNTGNYAGQMTYNLDFSGSGYPAVVNCMAIGYSWNSGTNSVSSPTLKDCGSRGVGVSGWSQISGTVSLGTFSYGSTIQFNKNSEYEHLNQYNDSTYNCEADYNAITATGHSNGSTTNTTSSYVPVLWSPDGSDSNCPGEYYTVVTWA